MENATAGHVPGTTGSRWTAREIWWVKSLRVRPPRLAITTPASKPTGTAKEVVSCLSCDRLGLGVFARISITQGNAANPK